MSKKKSHVPLYILHESLLFVWGTMSQAIRNRVAIWKVPEPAAFTLVHLYAHPEDAEPARLAECVIIPRQTMTFILDALEKRGLASRKPHSTDRRRKTIVLSAKGKKLAEAIIKDLLEFEAAALSTFSARELDSLKTLTRKFADALRNTETTMQNAETGTQK